MSRELLKLKLRLIFLRWIDCIYSNYILISEFLGYELVKVDASLAEGRKGVYEDRLKNSVFMFLKGTKV